MTPSRACTGLDAAVGLISEALMKGELVACTPDGTPIPRFSWPADASDPDGS